MGAATIQIKVLCRHFSSAFFCSPVPSTSEHERNHDGRTFGRGTEIPQRCSQTLGVSSTWSRTLFQRFAVVEFVFWKILGAWRPCHSPLRAHLCYPLPLERFCSRRPKTAQKEGPGHNRDIQEPILKESCCSQSVLFDVDLTKCWKQVNLLAVGIRSWMPGPRISRRLHWPDLF
jgi:hypothetical protein